MTRRESTSAAACTRNQRVSGVIELLIVAVSTACSTETSDSRRPGRLAFFEPTGRRTAPWATRAAHPASGPWRACAFFSAVCAALPLAFRRYSPFAHATIAATCGQFSSDSSQTGDRHGSNPGFAVLLGQRAADPAVMRLLQRPCRRNPQMFRRHRGRACRLLPGSVRRCLRRDTDDYGSRSGDRSRASRLRLAPISQRVGLN